MRVFACKDLGGSCCIIESEGEPVKPERFVGTGSEWRSLEVSRIKTYCSTLAPGTFRELKKLDVVSGEFEFVEEVKVPTLKEEVEAFAEEFGKISPRMACDNPKKWDSICRLYARMCEAADREPAPRYDEALIDELLEIRENVSASSGVLLRGDASKWSEPSNRRAAEILQALKRAKEGAQ